MQNKKLSMKTRIILVAVAVFIGLGFNGYKRIQVDGELDSLWFVTSGITILIVILVIYFILRKRD